MNCEYCNHIVKSHVALCSNCGRFGRTIPEYIRWHELDIPENRINDIHWLKRNAGIHNYNHPTYPRLIQMLKEIT